MPRLKYFSTSGKWEEYELGEHTTIGRHPDQDLQLLDRMISKEHAEITRRNDGRYEIADVGSRNGTTLNDESLEVPKVLRDGDEIGLGNHILKFYDGPRADQETTKDNSAIPTADSPSVFDNPTTEADTGALWERMNSVSVVSSIRKRISESKFLPESEIISEAVLRNDYEKLRTAAELSAEAATVFDFDRLLELIVDKAFELFKADRAAILLRDENGEMRTRLAVDRKKKPIRRFKISETLLDEVILEKSAVLSGDALQDQRFQSSNSLIVDNVRSTMCVPLLYQNEVLGVINLDTQLMTGAFEEKDLMILTGFAQQVAFTIQRGKLIEEMRQNAVIRDNLSRIISPHLINDVMSGKIELQKSGRLTNSTVLFADIRGFTHLTEQSDPAAIVEMLNAFFERMVECIFKHEGALDKFVGDEVMAFWGVSLCHEDHAIRAVKCAKDMMLAVTALNAERSADGLPPLQIGIGIATGTMIAGYMGSTQAMSYTIIGDTVNLGARLCAAAHPGEILINDAAWNHVKDEVSCLALPPMMVKGKQDCVSIYRVNTT